MTRRLGRSYDYIDGDILEWSGTRLGYSVDGAVMLDCMHTWPESIEGDLILLKSSWHRMATPYLDNI